MDVVVRWCDEGPWAHVAVDRHNGHRPTFAGFIRLSADLRRVLLRQPMTFDTAGMWESRLRLSEARVQ